MPRRGPMTKEHKDAIRQGRLQANVVKAYLETLELDRRRVADPATLRKRLSAVEERLNSEPNVLKALELRQQRLELAQSLEMASAEAEQQGLEKEFVNVAAEYAARKGLSYAAFREMGVPPKVLASAGIRR